MFIRYLEMLQNDPGDEEADAEAAAANLEASPPEEPATTESVDDAEVPSSGAGAPLADEDAPEHDQQLDDVARRLTIPDDPTVLSYLLGGIVQVETIRRQGLLEMPTTNRELEELAGLLVREIALLGRGLNAYTPDPRLASLQRN